MKVQNPFTGRSSGKFAGAVFSKWKDLNVARSKPTSVANPRTQGQINARSKFSAVVELSRRMKAVVLVGFASFRATMTEYNGFMKQNLNDAFGIDNSNNVTFDPPAFKAAVGANGSTVTDWSVSGSNLSITWPNTPNLSLGQKSTDVLCYALLDSGGVHVTSGVLANETRASSPATVAIPAGTGTGTFQLYTFFAADDLSSCEESYWNEIEI
jgi:hypothetical protein